MTTHLNTTDLDRVRTTAYYLSQDEARPEPRNQVDDWAEAETLESARLLSILERFPKLYAAFESASPPPTLATGSLGALIRGVREEDGVDALSNVERALEGLSSRRPPLDLKEVVGDLLSGADELHSETRWDRAVAELYVLETWNARGCLGSLGWPPPSGSGPSPGKFDCTLRVHDVVVASDIRLGSGSGFRRVRAAVSNVVDRWAAERGLGEVRTFLWIRGKLPTPAGGTVLNAAADLAVFDEVLRANTEVPSVPLGLRVGSTQLDVLLAKADAPSVASAFVSSLLPTFKKQIELKAKIAGSGGAPFLMTYVLLPGSGGDDAESRQVFDELAKRTSAGAMQLASSAGSHWLGVLLLDYMRGSPKTTCYVRPAANWPTALHYKVLASALDATVAPEARQTTITVL